MIILDMIKKNEIRIDNKMFTLENDILTLELDPQEYDITDKVITANFSATGVETLPLTKIGNIIQLPIYSNLIKYGLNFIQLNFRWGTDKLEQSGKIMWRIDDSISTTEVEQESVDIISYLISEVNRVISETGDIKEALDESITNANTINDTLTNEATGTIKVATDTGIDLEDTIEDANYVKGLVETTIDDSETAKTNLEGTIGAAGTAQTNLNNKIGEATTSKEVLDQAIVNNQIVTLPVFNAHKEDYATDVVVLMKNLIANGNFSNGTNGWSGVSFSISAMDNTCVATVTNLTSARIQRGELPEINHQYYAIAEIVPKYNTATYFRLGGVQYVVPVVTPNTINRISGIITAINNTEPFRIYHNTNISYQIGDTVIFKNIMLIDLTTTFGVGNEPTQQEMNELLNNYPDWFLSVNLFNAKKTVQEIKTLEHRLINVMGINNNSTVLKYNANGKLEDVEEVDGIIKKKTIITYSASNTVSSVTEIFEKHTIISTLVYSGNTLIRIDKEKKEGGL